MYRILAKWSVLPPLVLGAICFLSSTVLFPSLTGALVGFAAILGGLGAAAYQFCFRLEDVTRDELRGVREEQLKAYESGLDELASRLRALHDQEPVEFLERLRDLRKTLNTELLECRETASYVTLIEDQFNGLFDRCITDLRSLVPDEPSDHPGRPFSEENRRERDRIKKNIRLDVTKLSGVVDQLRGMREAPSNDREQLRHELDQNLRVAKAAREEVDERLGRIRGREHLKE